MSLDLRPRAVWDIEIFADEIRSEAGVFAATRFAQRLERTLSLLERFPELGERRESDDAVVQNLRVMAVQQYPHRLICFTPSPDGIVVHRVLHSSSDLDAIFGS